MDSLTVIKIVHTIIFVLANCLLIFSLSTYYGSNIIKDFALYPEHLEKNSQVACVIENSKTGGNVHLV